MALFYGVVWLYATVYSKLGNAQIYFFLGWLCCLVPAVLLVSDGVEDPKFAER